MKTPPDHPPRRRVAINDVISEAIRPSTGKDEGGPDTPPANGASAVAAGSAIETVHAPLPDGGEMRVTVASTYCHGCDLVRAPKVTILITPAVRAMAGAASRPVRRR